MSVQKGTVIYAKNDGINIYQEPIKNDLVWKMTKSGQKQKYFEWVKGARIGTATGEMTTNADGTYIQVYCELVWWRKRLVDSVREDKLGYLLISEDSFYYFVGLPDSQADTPVNTPVADTGSGTPGTNGSGSGSGEDTGSNTILWVLVAVLALVAGFLGFRKLSKRKK